MRLNLLRVTARGPDQCRFGWKADVLANVAPSLFGATTLLRSDLISGSVRRLMLIRMLWGKWGIRKMMRWLLFVVGMAVSLPAHAQLTAPVKNGDTTITVTGTRTRESKVEMSNWRMAETPHVVVFSQNDEKELRRYRAQSREASLPALGLDRPGGRARRDDQDRRHDDRRCRGFRAASTDGLALAIWPVPAGFAKTIYYDPREEGSVLATTKDGVNLVLRPSVRPSDEPQLRRWRRRASVGERKL